MTTESRMRAACDWAKQHTHKPFTGSVAAKEIDRVAKALGLKITGSYRTFIRQLGSENDFGINGVNNEYRNAGTLWTTRVMRNEYGLPRQYLVVWTNESGSHACVLDTSVETAPGEHAVYHMSPEIWQETMTKAFDSFLEFFEHYFEVPRPKASRKTKSEKRRAAGSSKRSAKAPSRKR